MLMATLETIRRIQPLIDATNKRRAELQLRIWQAEREHRDQVVREAITVAIDRHFEKSA